MRQRMCIVSDMLRRSTRSSISVAKMVASRSVSAGPAGIPSMTRSRVRRRSLGPIGLLLRVCRDVVKGAIGERSRVRTAAGAGLVSVGVRMIVRRQSRRVELVRYTRQDHRRSGYAARRAASTPPSSAAPARHCGGGRGLLLPLLL